MYRTILVLVTSLALSGCMILETFSAWAGDNRAVYAVRVVVADEIYKAGPEKACDYAFRASEIVREARKRVGNPVLTFTDIRNQISGISALYGLSETTTAFLLEIADRVVVEHELQMSKGVLPESARVTFNRFLDAIDGVALISQGLCK